MESAERLISRLRGLDGKSYGAYKSLRGIEYDYGDFTLTLERVQSDPYAPPSALIARARRADLGLADADLGETLDAADRVAAADFLARAFHQATRETRGNVRIAAPGQEILARSSCTLTETEVQVRFQAQLPARGRRILGRAAAELFDFTIPDCVFAALDFIGSDDPGDGGYSCARARARRDALLRHVYTYRDYLELRRQVTANGWVTFIADDAVLARESGVSDRPMRDAVPFAAPDTLAATVQLPHAGAVRGLVIKRGICVIAGGGYHGKSTLLAAIERGVWAHIPGDGRELVATVPDAMKVRAEDGRAVTGVDISLFIRDLPGRTDTRNFSTLNASGSTSQAAAIAEGLEAACSVLLIDEDTSATNLMIRDERMRQLVRAEPITPLADRIRALRDHGVSTLVVMGGSGEYLQHADQVLLLEDYRCHDATATARAIVAADTGAGTDTSTDTSAACADAGTETMSEAAAHPRAHARASAETAVSPAPTVAAPATISGLVRARIIGAQRAPERPKTKTTGTTTIVLDREPTDIAALAAVVDSAQTEAIAAAMRIILENQDQRGKNRGDARRGAGDSAAGSAPAAATLWERCERLAAEVAARGLDTLRPGAKPAFFAEFRACDLLGALSRYRGLKVNAQRDAEHELD